MPRNHFDFQFDFVNNLDYLLHFELKSFLTSHVLSLISNPFHGKWYYESNEALQTETKTEIEKIYYFTKTTESVQLYLTLQLFSIFLLLKSYNMSMSQFQPETMIG